MEFQYGILKELQFLGLSKPPVVLTQEQSMLHKDYFLCRTSGYIFLGGAVLQ